MDERDFQILAHLVRDPGATLSAVARAVGMARSAVEARYRRMREEGWLVGFEAMPNPALFGKVAIIAAYAPPAKPPKPLARVLEVEGVVGYSLNHDGQVAVTYYAKGPDDPPPPDLDRMLGGPPPRRFVRETPRLKPPGAALSRLQWRVLEELLTDARMSDAALARAVGRDARTVGGHRRAMLRAGYYRIYPGVLADQARGIVLFHLYISGKACGAPAELLRVLPWAAVIERTEQPLGLFVLSRAATLGEALAARDRVAAFPGVEHVEIVLESEGALAVERLQAMCRDAARQAPGARAA